jgi:hypothetical protein
MLRLVREGWESDEGLHSLLYGKAEGIVRQVLDPI